MGKRWFETATPESVGISSAAIERLIDTMCMHKEFQETHSFMIIRRKKIVAEGYFAPFREEQHVIHSCSKAFTATAIGFALQEGLLELDDPASKYLPEYLPQFMPEGQAAMVEKLTIRHLLTMSNGHEKNVFKRPYGEIEPAQLLKDFFACGFSSEPGAVFRYENTNSYVLSAVIKKVTGMDLMEYIRPRLLDKLDIHPFYSTDDDGMFVGYGTMRLTMEELARFGQFYMDGCVWEGERLLSEEWASMATAKHIESGNKERNGDWDQGYAFHLWRGQHNCFRFCGAYGQICAVYPDYDLIFLLNSGHTDVVQDELNTFYEHILTKLEEQLPENPESLDALQTRCASLRLPACFSGASPLVSRVSGKTYTIRDCGEIVEAKLDFCEEVCRISLAFRNGDALNFDAGLKNFAYTDCADTYVVSLQPKDNAVCAATGYWKQLNEFCVDAHMVPTHAMFRLEFVFDGDGVEVKAQTQQGRAHELGRGLSKK